MMTKADSNDLYVYNAEFKGLLEAIEDEVRHIRISEMDNDIETLISLYDKLELVRVYLVEIKDGCKMVKERYSKYIDIDDF